VPQLRVFVSSTAYDLGLVRGQLRSFINQLGHVPVLSDFSGVLYDPSLHTQQSCVQELATCDMVILIVGGRWGSVARPEFVEEIDETAIDDPSGQLAEMLTQKRVSVTQLEVLAAVAKGIPIFVFVDDSVLAEARLYEANRELADNLELAFPSMQDAETAGYVFRFLAYVRSRTTGNAIIGFRQIEDIQSHLRTQWSALLQRSVSAEFLERRDQFLLEAISEQLEDVKAAVLASVQGPNARLVADGVLSYRALTALLEEVGVSREVLLTESPPNWQDLLSSVGVKNELRVQGASTDSNFRPEEVALVFDESVLLLRTSIAGLNRRRDEWESFRAISQDERQLILEALTSRTIRPIRERRYSIDGDVQELLEMVSVVPRDQLLRLLNGSTVEGSESSGDGSRTTL